MPTVVRVVFLLVISIFTFGCSHNYYNVPRETYESKVRVLGVAPLMIDPESDIKHPEKDALVKIVQEYSRKSDKELVSMLRETGVYFSVRQIEEDPATLFASLVSRREWRDDAGIVYNKYFFRKDELKDFMAKQGLDGLMLLTVNGLTRKDKVFSSNLFSFLETDFNFLTVSAQIVDSNNSTLWEYPNFRQRSLSYPMLLPLQYPDFDEATANLSENVDVKFKTIPGITNAFKRSESSSLQNNVQVPVLFGKIFKDMVSMLQPKRSFFGLGKAETPAAPGTAATTTTTPPAVAPAATPTK
jgi:hypothetical protein